MRKKQLAKQPTWYVRSSERNELKYYQRRLLFYQKKPDRDSLPYHLKHKKCFGKYERQKQENSFRRWQQNLTTLQEP